MSERVMEVTDQDFPVKIEGAGGTVIVDFWAEWCAPCKAMAPVFEEVASEYDGRAAFAKLNIDENIDTPTRLGVMNIPTFIVFKDGQEMERVVGFVSKKQLMSALDKALQ